MQAWKLMSAASVASAGPWRARTVVPTYFSTSPAPTLRPHAVNLLNGIKCIHPDLMPRLRPTMQSYPTPRKVFSCPTDVHRGEKPVYCDPSLESYSSTLITRGICSCWVERVHFDHLRCLWCSLLGAPTSSKGIILFYFIFLKGYFMT